MDGKTVDSTIDNSTVDRLIVNRTLLLTAMAVMAGLLSSPADAGVVVSDFFSDSGPFSNDEGMAATSNDNPYRGLPWQDPTDDSGRRLAFMDAGGTQGSMNGTSSGISSAGASAQPIALESNVDLPADPLLVRFTIEQEASLPPPFASRLFRPPRS